MIMTVMNWNHPGNESMEIHHSNNIEHFTSYNITIYCIHSYNHYVVFRYGEPSNIHAVILDSLMNRPFRIMGIMYKIYTKFSMNGYSCQLCPISLDIGLVLLVFGLSYRLAQIQHTHSISHGIERLPIQEDIIYMS